MISMSPDVSGGKRIGKEGLPKRGNPFIIVSKYLTIKQMN